MQTRARRPGVRTAVALAVGAASLACSPALNWRETRPEGSGAALMFPCRPEKQERTVRIGAAVLSMQLHSCSAGGATFALAAMDVADPAGVTEILTAFRARAAANLAGTENEEGAFLPPGATPNAQSARVLVTGERPDGRRVVAQAAFFVKGLRLYQATVLGADSAIGREAVDTFFSAIRLP